MTSLDFMCIGETKLDKYYKNGSFTKDKYRSFRKDNKLMSGGLFAFVRSDLPCLYVNVHYYMFIYYYY